MKITIEIDDKDKDHYIDTFKSWSESKPNSTIFIGGKGTYQLVSGGLFYKETDITQLKFEDSY